jgi:diadenylate cyclase
MGTSHLLESLQEYFETLLSVAKTIRSHDILDMAILAYAIYMLIKFLKENRAGQLVKGIMLYLGAYFLSVVLHLNTISYIISKTFDIGILALFIMFQPEIRRVLEKIGHAKISSIVPGISSTEKEMEDIWRDAVNAVCQSCEDLSSTCTGALIVIEQKTKLGEQIENGTVLNARPSKELLGNIFYPKTPLHDGAVIIRDGMIIAAACFLPKPAKEESINKKLGSRHRAAIGMSENSDAIVIVVSEETGQISVAEDGVLVRDFSKESLRSLLRRKLITEPAEEKFMLKRAAKGRAFRLKTSGEEEESENE